MGLEQDIRSIVEQVLLEMKTGTPVNSGVTSSTQTVASGNEDEALTDLAKVDLQRYLQVPQPLAGQFPQQSVVCPDIPDDLAVPPRHKKHPYPHAISSVSRPASFLLTLALNSARKAHTALFRC